MEVAVAIWASNIIVATVVLWWCNKKIKDINNKWKK